MCGCMCAYVTKTLKNIMTSTQQKIININGYYKWLLHLDYRNSNVVKRQNNIFLNNTV